MLETTKITIKRRALRSVAAFLAAILTFATFGCGKGTGAAAETTASSETTTGLAAETQDPRLAIEDGLPDVTYDGADWVLLGRDNKIDEYLLEEATGDYVDDAIVKRNQRVEADYAVKLSMVGEPEDWGRFNQIAQICMTGDGTYSLIENNIVVTALVGQNAFYNWNSFDFVDFEKPWWSQAAIEAFDIGGHLEFVTGDYSLTLWQGFVVMYFNKQVAENKKIENLYQLVLDHKWTIEKLRQISSEMREDLDGNSVYDENDMYGFVTGNGNNFDNFVVSSDVPITVKDDEGFPMFAFNTERSAEMHERVFELSQSPGVYAIDETKDGATLVPMFMNNRALIYAGLLKSANEFRKMETDFGIIPYPLYDEEQEKYQTFSKAGFAGFAIPMTTKDPEMAAVITTALMAESYKQVIPAYYDTTLKTKSARDDESQAMLDIIRDGFALDIGCTLLDTQYLFGMLRNMVILGKFNFSSAMKANEKRAVKYFEKLKENILEVREQNG